MTLPPRSLLKSQECNTTLRVVNNDTKRCATDGPTRILHWNQAVLVLLCWSWGSMLCMADEATSPPVSSQAPQASTFQTSTSQAPVSQTPVAGALKTIFSPMEAPTRRTMGLLQRNFLDKASGRSDLEVAIVIDGTDSMAAEIEGVKNSIEQMLRDLRRFRDNRVRAAIVVYRDHGSPSGEVSLVLPSFTSDPKQIIQAVETLHPENGAPFFYELPDLGIHQAITELPWSKDPSVTKWILLFGDAPPYEASFNDKRYPHAKRRYSDDVLTSLAARKGIEINCVLCTSNDEAEKSYETVVDQTRQFMSVLSSDTGGIMLDLSYPEIQSSLVEAAQRTGIDYAKINSINAADLAAVARSNIASQGSGEWASVRVAVIPHEAFSGISFDPERETVQVATAIKRQMRLLPGIRVASTVDVQRQVRRLSVEGLPDDATVRGLASRLGVDYLIWGQIPHQATVQTAAYRRRDGDALVTVSHDGSRDRLTNVLLTAAAKIDAPDEPFCELSKRLAVATERAILEDPIAKTSATAAELLTAIEALEQSLAFTAGSEDSLALLKKAAAATASAISAEPSNPLAHWLSANASFNLAAVHFRKNDLQAGNQAQKSVKRSLRLANQNVNKIKSQPLRLEIAADYALLTMGDTKQAIEKYSQMTDLDQPLSTQLRGHWMLSGIHAGDWSTPGKFIDMKESRKHVIEILANWPNSPESVQLKRWLMWDEKTKRTQFDFLPKINQSILNSGV